MNDKVKTFHAKQKLEVTRYEADIPYGDKTKALDRMNAKNLALPEDDPLYDKPVRYTIFKADLKTFLRALGEGSQAVVDYEETARPDSEYGPDRTIVQVYDNDGKPVSTKQARAAGGSPRRFLEEDMALEAMKQVGALLTTPTEISLDESMGLEADTWKRIMAKYWTAVERGLDHCLKQPAARSADSRQKPPVQRQKADAATPDKKDETKGDTPIKHAGDLLTRASKLNPPVAKEDLLVALSSSDISEVQDLEEAWKCAQMLSRTVLKEAADKKAQEAVDEETAAAKKSEQPKMPV